MVSAMNSPLNPQSTFKGNKDTMNTTGSAIHSPFPCDASMSVEGGIRQKKSRRSSKDGFESVQDVIFESMRETQRLRRSRSHQGQELDTNIFFDTVEDLRDVASGTIESLKRWTTLQPQGDGQHPHSDSTGCSVPGPNSQRRARECNSDHDTSCKDQSGTIIQCQNQKDNTNIFQDLSWPFSVCGLQMQARLPERNQITPHIDRVKEAVTKAVNGDLNNAANDIWKFAAGAKDDDDNTVGTLDTLQEENNQIRRLGSWGTVNTSGTGCTNDTGFNSFEQGQTPREINIDMEDDDGNTIDPVLLQKAQQAREKRTPRREKLVKFDYPPIKSLRQCPRPDPQDLPALFFTEHELDQIEEDRYSTMSTDDIEIVAVSSKLDESKPAKSRFKNYKSPKAKTGTNTTFDSPQADHGATTGREQPEIGWKQTRGRSSTPHRRRNDDDEEDADIPTHQSKSPSNNGRLVKGVQIYLRERSTGL